MIPLEEIKVRVANRAVSYVTPGMRLGLGSGSTMSWFVIALSQRIKEGLHIKVVPTSLQVKELAEHYGITLTTLNEVDELDLTIDGADEIDKDMHLIKGGGAALLQEKMVAFASRSLLIIADHTKRVEKLGKFPLPVEVIPYGWKQVQKRIEEFYKIQVTVRKKNNEPLLTDHGHYILDCHFKQIDEPQSLNVSLHLIPGVVETGLFVNMAKRLCIGYPDGSIKDA